MNKHMKMSDLVMIYVKNITENVILNSVNGSKKNMGLFMHILDMHVKQK